jgi:ATP-binding cassette subfamily C (CFTR/MRP) protein 1
VGVGFMVLLMPINTVVFSIVSKQRREVLKYSDLRVKMMNEILSGIRIIKFYAWERPFGKEVSELRGNELKALTRLAYTSAIGFSLILMAAPLIQPVLVFVTYVAIQDEPLTASTAFTTVALFNMMRFPFAFLPMGLLQYIQSKISLSRLERYLDLPELTEYVEPNPPSNASESETVCGSITIRNGTFSWVDPEAGPVRPIQDEKPKKEKKPKRGKKGDDEISSSEHSHKSEGSKASENTEATTKVPVITLREINCHVESGSLVAIVGTVGSGKSSFLSAILGELEPIHDSKVYMPRAGAKRDGFVSYCSQTPWVVNDTLRGNILFGREFDQERYEEIINACALRDDLAVLPAGDMTEIGERGINLSGGQKARVSLARAMYSKETKIVLMDDPLSAVDSHVGEWIFSKAITGSVSKGTTRMIVTHHVHLLARCDKVIVMEKGTIQHHGSYEELVAKGVDFAGAIDVSKIKVTESNEEEAEKKVEKSSAKAQIPEKKGEDQIQLQKNGKKLVKDEEREEGSVAGSAYMHYARVGGLVVAFMVLLVQAFGRGAEVMAGFWLAFWAEAASDEGGLSTSETNYYVAIYAVFGLIGVIGLTVRSLLIAVHRLAASKILHDGLTESILRAPVSFFDVTPTGRVLNRFAADMDKIDLELTQTLSQGISTLFNVLGAIAAIIAATRGTFLVPLVPISYCYYVIQKWFRKTSTELQRINSIANSPIFADFSQTLSGTNTIRAYGEETRFFEQCKHSFDTMNASYILIQLVSSWLSLRLDILGGFIGAFIGGLAVATYSSSFIPAGWLGLALSYSIEVTNFLKHGVKMIATLEAQMNSVERVLFYTNQVQPEAPEFIPDVDPAPSEWPTKGNIEFRGASMRYRDGPLVLKNISLQVKGSEKIGVCGRTGSGKSSLMISLFRITELEEDGGAIIIDDLNVREIGTSTLRLNLSIIPQDPIIFSNTVRYNLDPFKSASTEELWEVLKKVQMDTVIQELPSGLDELVSEGGENFSQGQRQLLCIARALLRKPKILVMDEATASIDNATDAHIQTMIRENFRDATVLTIAHRLNTIMDSDRVLVLDNGNIAEFDTPEKLLEKEDGLFRAMVEKSKAASGVALVED